MKGRLHTWLLLKLAEGCMTFGMPTRALAILREVVAAEPRHPKAWGIIAYLEAKQGRFSDAIEAFDRALAITPADEALLFNSAYALQRAGRHGEAIERFERVIAANAFMDRAWYGLGLSLAHVGRHDEAVTRLKEAARLQPMNPYAGYQLASSLFKLGRQDEVRAEYERVKGFDPKISAQMKRDFGIP